MLAPADHNLAESGVSGRVRAPRASTGAVRRPRRPACVRADDRPLRLLPGKTRAMTSSEEQQLVDALAELLAVWLAAHPDRLPDTLRSRLKRDLLVGTRIEEQS